MNDARHTWDGEDAPAASSPRISGVFLSEEALDDVCSKAVRAYEASVEMPPDLEARLARVLDELEEQHRPTARPAVDAPPPPAPRRRPASRSRPVAHAAAAAVTFVAFVQAAAPIARDPVPVPSPASGAPVSAENRAPVGAAPLEPPAPDAVSTTAGRGDASEASKDEALQPDLRRTKASTGAPPIEPALVIEPRRGVDPPASSAGSQATTVTPARAARMLEAARTSYSDGDPAEALSTLKACGTACFEGPLRENTLALKAQALYANGDVTAAAMLAGQLRLEFPGSPYVPVLRPILLGPGGFGLRASNDRDAPAPNARYAQYTEGGERDGALPGSPGQLSFAILGAPAPWESATATFDSIEESRTLADGNVRVIVVFRDPSDVSESTPPERVSVLFTARGVVIDVDPLESSAAR